MKPIKFSELEEITKDEWYELPDKTGVSINNHYTNEVSYFRKIQEINYDEYITKYLKSLGK